jgi:hypothetical protein
MVRSWLLTITSVLGLLPRIAAGQLTTEEMSQARRVVSNRIEALTILGGDFGLPGGSFSFTSLSPLQPGPGRDTSLRVTKFGGDGDVGDPRPLGALPIAWQPRLQGNMGYLDSTNHIPVPLDGDVSTFGNFSMQFGGGARFWLSERFSLTPTLMGMYGHTSNEYAADSSITRLIPQHATRPGLVDWNVDTWTLRPALDLRYVVKWERLVVTLSSDPTYFHTQSFKSSNAGVSLNGNSGSLDTKIDLDVPLGSELFGHELHAGGYFSQTDLFGGLKVGLETQHINEIHGRLVLDYLNQLWKFQWIGIGASYLWGPNITGWEVGADIAFHF